MILKFHVVSVVVPSIGFVLSTTTDANGMGELEALSITVPRMVCVGCCECNWPEVNNAIKRMNEKRLVILQIYIFGELLLQAGVLVVRVLLNIF